LIWSAAAGCASGPERAASEAFQQVERRDYAAREPLPVLDETATLSDYLAYAALNNPGLRAAFHRWQAAVERIRQVRSLPEPRLSYGYFIREVETRVGPQRQKVGISQGFPWFGKLKLQGEQAVEAAEAARERYEAEKLKLFYRVKSAYAEYYYLSRAIATTKENLALMRYLEQVVRTRYRAAAAGHPDVIKAQVELGKLDERLRSLEDLRAPLAARLDAALGREPGEPAAWPDSLPEEKAELKEEELLLRAKQANPELKALAFEIGKAEDAVALARKEYFPDFALGLDYIQTDPSSMAGVKDSGKDPVVPMISIEIPIWRGKYRAGEREAKARLQGARELLRERTNTLESEVKLAAYGLRDAARKIDLYRDALIPKAKEHLRATETAFKAGKADFLNLIDAQRALLEFELIHQRALADQLKRRAELEMLVGKEIPPLVRDEIRHSK